MQASGAPRVLIAEDSPDLGDHFGAFLRAQGFALLTARGADAALEKLDGVEVVLVGAVPGLDLAEFVRQVKARSVAEVLRVTGGAGPPGSTRLPGVFEFLALPLDEAELLRTLRAAQASSQRARRHLARERLAAMGELANGLAHEINNPMTFVRSNLKFVEDCLLELLGTVALLNDGKPEEALSAWDAAGGQGLYAEVQYAIDEARQGSDRISRVVRDLRHASWIPGPSPERFALLEAMEEALRLAGGALRRVDVRIAIDRQLRVEGDRERLTQALMSLVLSAAQTTEDQALAITARLETAWILLELSAGGPPSDGFDRLADSASGERFTGNLGLAIGRQVIVASGGELSVHHRDGGGTTLLVKLPSAGERGP